MKHRSFRSIITTNYGYFLAAGALCFLFGMAGSASANAMTAAEADVQAKTQVGTPNAEARAAADPIRACGPSPRDKDGSSWGRYFKQNGTNMRRSPSTSAQICGQGQKSHRVDYHCYTVGSDGRTWTYLRDATTRYAGWVRDDLLVGNGSYVRC